MNIRPLLSFLEVRTDRERESFYEFCDRLKECGDMGAPSGKYLKIRFERRQKKNETSSNCDSDCTLSGGG